MQGVLNIATNAALEASKLVVRAIEHLSDLKITEKSRNEFASEVDRRTEQYIIDTIRKTFPDHAILAEETGLNESKSGNKEYLWIIDPLDGTTNYLHGVPHFAVSIALKKKDRLEIGVIYDPIRQELFTAQRGSSARLNDKRIRVSQQKKLEGALLGTGFPYKPSQDLSAYLKTFKAVFPGTAGIRRTGAASLDLAYVAAGRFDGFWEFSLNPWDMAAGILLIKEAGGLVADFHGEEKYFDSGNLVAGTPKIFKAMLQAIQPTL